MLHILDAFLIYMTIFRLCAIPFTHKLGFFCNSGAFMMRFFSLYYYYYYFFIIKCPKNLRTTKGLKANVTVVVVVVVVVIYLL